MNRALPPVPASRFAPALVCALALGLPLAFMPAPASAAEGDKLFSVGVHSLDTQDPFHILTLQYDGPLVPVAHPGRDFDQVFTVLGSNHSEQYPLVLYTSAVELYDEVDTGTTLADLIDAIYQSYTLDYILMDLEVTGALGGQTVEENIALNNQRIQDIIDYVRNDIEDSQVKFGNYNYYSGADDLTFSHNPNIYTEEPGIVAKSQAAHEFYNGDYVPPGEEDPLPGGLTVAMPRLYVNSYYIHHASEEEENGIEGWEQPDVSPTQRSGLFWAVLERFSIAKRNLPDGDELIPFVSDYELATNWDPDEGEEPTIADNAASITHYRLRGADGIQIFGGYNDGDPGYIESGAQNDDEGKINYHLAVADGWEAVDPLFANPGVTQYLNAAVSPDDVDDRTKHFATNKNGGIEWSAAQKGNRVMAIVSNLSGATKSADDLVGWADRPQLPAQLPQDVSHGEHALMQFRTSYLDNNNMEHYTVDETMDNQGADSWSGPGADDFEVQATPGSGNPSAQAVVSIASGQNDAWYTSGNPGYASTDKVVYSAWLYVDGAGIGFGPANTTDPAPTGDIPGGNEQGPRFQIGSSDFEFRKTFNSAGPNYHAVNLSPADETWYEVQVVADGDNNTGKVYLRDVTNGQRDFTLLVFDDTTTTGTTEQYWEVPLALSGSREISDFDGWIVRSFGGADSAIDNLNTGYYVPRMNDNFEHYDASVTNDSQTVAWNGPLGSTGPANWTVAAPSGSGNDSNLAAQLDTSSSTSSAWWQTENPQFTATDHTVYSAKIFSGDGFDEIETFFGPVNTDGTDSDELVAGSQVGFSAGFTLTGDFFVTTPAGSFTDADFDLDADTWYDIQVQIDQTADAGDGIARIWIKDFTLDDTPVLLDFDSGAGTEISLELSSSNDPTVWDGWQISAYGLTTQLDSFRSFLFPYVDFDTYNLYIDDPDFSVSLSERAQLAVPEPASLALLSAACGLAICRRHVG